MSTAARPKDEIGLIIGLRITLRDGLLQSGETKGAAGARIGTRLLVR